MRLLSLIFLYVSLFTVYVSGQTNWGVCKTATGQVGACLPTTQCPVTPLSDKSLCPGDGSIKCCLKPGVVPPPPPTFDWGSCTVGARVGKCQDRATCTGAGAASFAGFCPGPDQITCCVTSASSVLPTPVWAPPVPSNFYGACQPSSSILGSCRNVTQSPCSGTVYSGHCANAANSADIQCCADGGPAAVDQVDLPGGFGFDVSGTRLTSTIVNCLTAAPYNVKYAVVRGWTQTCAIDPTARANILLLASLNITADILMVPSYWCAMDATAQVNALMASLNGLKYGRIWIQVARLTIAGGWSPDTQANVNWIAQAAGSIANAIGSARVGIFTSPFQWSKIVGSANSGLLSSYPMWYQNWQSNYTANAHWRDFNIPGFNVPYMKQVGSLLTCGMLTNFDWLPTKSSVTAPVQPAPPSPPIITYGNCLDQANNTGVCMDAVTCNNLNRVAARGDGICVSAPASAACCLNSSNPTILPEIPAGTLNVPLIYGTCNGTLNGAPVDGVCQQYSNLCTSLGGNLVTDPNCVTMAGNDATAGCCVSPDPSEEWESSSVTYQPAHKFVPAEFHHALNYKPMAGSTPPPNRACINQAGLKLIESFEGFYANFYLDAVGIKTIGFGTACHAYDCSKIRPPITRAQASAIMFNDLMARYAPCVRSKIKVQLTSNQFSALTSFIYNVGCGALDGSVGDYVNAGNFAGVRSRLMLWNKAGGKVLNGLTRRRAAEADLFESNAPSPCADSSLDGGSNEGQSWGSCSFNGQVGTCIESNTCSSGNTKSGLCPGPSSVTCCLGSAPNPPPPARCGSGGTCQSSSSCSGTKQSGLCAGGSDIICCIPNPLPPSCGNGGRCVKTSSCQGTTQSGLCAGPSDVKCCFGSYTAKAASSTKQEIQSSYHPFRNEMVLIPTHLPDVFEPATDAFIPAPGGQMRAITQPWWPNAHRDELRNAGAMISGAPKIVLHTTEGGSYAGARNTYSGTNPHFTVTYERGYFEAYQHTPINLAGMALRTDPSFSPNRNNAIQIEIVGFAQKVSALPKGYLDGIALLLRWIESQTGSARQAAQFLPYPDSYGNNPYRMTPSRFSSFSGICGHQHVPFNSHGDPGNIDIAYLIKSNGYMTNPPSNGGGSDGTTSYGSCSDAGAVGTCINTNLATCAGNLVSGKCSGPANIRCCIETYGTCSVGGRNGRCVPSTSCSGNSYSGLCPGPSSVRCCIPNYGTCSSGGVTGTCQETSSCTGTVKTGLCAGPSSITCCLPKQQDSWGACKVGTHTGSCVRTTDCKATSAPGYCPNSPSNVQCCYTPKLAASRRDYGSCENNGKCVDVADCTGTARSGVCPGGENIVCCSPSEREAKAPVPYFRPSAEVITSFNQTASLPAIVSPTATTNAVVSLGASCSVNGVSGWCVNASLPNACPGLQTPESGCIGVGVACCTAPACSLGDATNPDGICLAVTDCEGQGGFSTPGFCGETSDASPQCCTNVGSGLCDNAKFKLCLQYGGQPDVCASSFGCVPLPEHFSLTEYNQNGASGDLVHYNITESEPVPDPSSSSSSSTGSTNPGQGGSNDGMRLMPSYLSIVSMVMMIILSRMW